MSRSITLFLGLFFVSSFCFTSHLKAQTFSDSSSLSFLKFLEIVRSHHPAAMQAEIQIDKGDAEVLSARGNFDPQLYTDIAQKYFKGEQYYHLLNGGIKIPTWFGVELYAGYENNRGQNLNPQSYTPDAGLAYAGLSIPLGQDLILDKRRAQLRKAQLSQKMTIEERRLILNELIMEASEAYWNWYQSYHVFEVYTEGYNLAKERFTAIKRSAELGELASIDTVEAGIQLQSREISMHQARLDYMNAKAMLSIYLWQEGVIPLELGDNVFPLRERSIAPTESMYQTPPLDRSNSIENHPEVRFSQLKIEQLDIERRLAIEQLKPQINLKYNALNQPLGNNPIANYSMKNYTWGADFQMPILLRNGRGALKMTQLNIQDATLALESKQAIIQMKADQATNEWSVTSQQIEIFKRTVNDLEILFNAELVKFSIGESSLFLVNTRESNFISAQIKLIEMISKNQKSLLKTYYILGLLQ